MKTTLDGATDCPSELQAPHEQQVGLKFKRKVLDLIQQRQFLKQRRPSRRALEPARRQVERATAGQPPPASERALEPEEQKQREEKLQDASHILSGQLATQVAAMDDKTSLQQHHKHSAHLSSGQQQPQQQQQQRALASMGQLDITNGRPQLGGKFQAHIAGDKQQFYQLPVSSQPPKVLPNNTEVEDLCKCHDNLLPKVTRATAKTVELFSACSPGWLNKRVAHKQPPGAGYVNSEVALTDSEEEEEEEQRPHELTPAVAAGFHENATKNSPSRSTQIIRPNRGRRKLKFEMPEAVVKLNISLKPDDYNRGLCILTNDVRYQLHLLLYRRLQTIWTLFSTILCILVPVLLLATLEPLVIGCACLCWLALQTAGALLTRQFCTRLDQMLEKAVAQVNSYFMDHNLMLGVINVGGLFARARLHIPLLYFDTSQCREQIESIISVDLRKKGEASDWPGDKAALKAVPSGHKWRKSNKPDRQFAINYSKMGLGEIGPESQMSFAQSQLAKKIVLRYSQRWISFYDKQKLMFTDDTAEPRHLSTGKCLCQFIEEHFKYADFAEDGQPASGSQGQLAHQSIPTNVIETKSDTCRQLGSELDASRAAAAVVLQMPESQVADEQQVELRKSSPLSSMFRHQNHLSSDLSLQQQLDLLVPTLSHLVSSHDHSKGPSDQSNASEFNSYTSSRLLTSLSSSNQQNQQQIERLESNSSPTTEHSLDLTEASDSTRNEDLIKRLKLLLDSRKDEFSRTLDGPKLSPRPLSILGDKSTLSPNMKQMSQNSSTQTVNMQDETNNNGSSPISQLGKRFFSQTDGSFFLGTKKSHEGVYGKQQQILEIC